MGRHRDARILLLAFILSCGRRGCCEGDRSCGKGLTSAAPDDDVVSGSSSDLTAQEASDVVDSSNAMQAAFSPAPLDVPSGTLRRAGKPRPPSNRRPSFLIAKPFRDQRP